MWRYRWARLIDLSSSQLLISGRDSELIELNAIACSQGNLELDNYMRIYALHICDRSLSTPTVCITRLWILPISFAHVNSFFTRRFLRCCFPSHNQIDLSSLIAMYLLFASWLKDNSTFEFPQLHKRSTKSFELYIFYLTTWLTWQVEMCGTRKSLLYNRCVRSDSDRK